METLKSTKTDLLNLRPDQLVANEENPRNGGSYEDPLMINSIEQHGVLVPMLVKKLKEKTEDGLDKFLIVEGNRRFYNAKLANNFGSFTFPAKPIKIESKDVHGLAISLGMTARNLTTIELGEALKREIENGKTQLELANEYALHQSYISMLVNGVEKLPDAVKDKIQSNEISFQSGLMLLKELNGDEKAMLKTITMAAEKASKGKRQKNSQISNKEIKESLSEVKPEPEKENKPKPKTPAQKLLAELSNEQFAEFIIPANLKILETIVKYEKGEINMETACSVFQKD